MEKNKKINKNSTIRCDNKYHFVFFKCNYQGTPTIKLPIWIKLLKPMYFFGLYNNVLQFTFAQYGRYIREENYFCPKCGKEMTDNNLTENYKESSPSFLYRLLIFTTLTSLILSIKYTVNLSTAGPDIALIYFSVFFVSLFLMMVSK